MVPLHNHSEYSALDGYSTPVEIADRIEELGLPGAFLTDHGTVAGLVAFAEAMTWKNKKKGIKRDLFFGFGMEAYMARESRADREYEGKKFRRGSDAFHLILLAETQEGYKNLLRISDEAHRSGFYYDPRVDWELLGKYNEGLIATTACMGSLFSQEIMKHSNTKPIDRMLRIFGERRFFIELHTYDTDEQCDLNEAYVSIAREKGIEVVYANDAHYAKQDQWSTHEALIAAQYNVFIRAPKKHSNYTDEFGDAFHPPCLYIMSEEDVRERLAYLPADIVDRAIANSDAIAARCQVDLPEVTQHLPKWKPTQLGPVTAAEKLLELVREGLTKRYDDPNLRPEQVEEIMARAEFEFDALVDAGLQDYFLIVWDFINWAEEHGIIVGPGRGSAGGSIVAYALGITSVDPIKYGLQFERFWNPGRAKGLPDIDIDFPNYGRSRVINYVTNKYGLNNVMPIGNHVRMRPRSAIDKSGKVLYEHPPYAAMTLIKMEIAKTTDAGQQKPWDEMWETLGEWAKNEGKPHPLEQYKASYPDLFELAELLSGRLSTYSVHASAIVVSDIDLRDQLPCRSAIDDSAKERVLCTQAEMHGVEDMGFPKFDFLGLRNLDTVMYAAALSGEFGDPDLLVAEIRGMDSPKYVPNEEAIGGLREIIQHLRWNVNFNHLPDSYWEQFDKGFVLGFFQVTKAAIRIARQLKPRSIEDLAFLVALNRPGPLRDKDENGRSTVDRFLSRRLGKEEVVYSHPILEPILVKTYGDFLYQEQVIDFFKVIGYDLSEADHIRKMLGKKLVEEMAEEFPRYEHRATENMSKTNAEGIWNSIVDFSKYSFNKSHAVEYGTITAWTAYAKWKWLVGDIMASIITDGDNVGAYISEGRRMGVDISFPNVNESGLRITKVGDRILYGLVDIKGMGMEAAKWVIKHRPYTSYEDFQRKLKDAGEIWRTTPKDKRPARSPNQTIPANMIKALYRSGAFEAIGDPRDMDDGERAEWEKELLGVAFTDVFKDEIRASAAKIDKLETPAAADTDEVGSVRVVGIITEVNKLRTRADAQYHPDEDMAQVWIEWNGERLMFAAFPEAYERYSFVLKPSTLVRLKLKTGPKGASLEMAELLND